MTYLQLVILVIWIVGINGFTINEGPRVIPITILAGFLGSGKTTLLQYLLNNNAGVKIAVVVNDVAEVNIDNRLIVGSTASSPFKQVRPAGVVELSNGCACCSLSDELLPSVSELITLSDMRSQASGDSDDGFDHIVIELSGVASPKTIRATFQDAEYYGMPLMDRVRLDTFVTVIDCSTFLNYLQDNEGKLVNEDESPQLFFKNGESPSKNNDGDEWPAWERNTPETATVSQLLVEQTEISDVILLNKIDLLGKEDSRELNFIESLVRAMNPRANILQTQFGMVEKLEHVLASARGHGVADSGITDDHRDAIKAISHTERRLNDNEESETYRTTGISTEETGSHGHKHGSKEICTDKECTDPTHSHNHSHEPENLCTDVECTDPSHSHNHSHELEEICTDVKCTDPTHSHNHSHEHAEKPKMPGGIGSFVFRARRPFHPTRLLKALKMLPIARGLPSDIDAGDSNVSEEKKLAMSSILRSKGFCWMADSHIRANYWSHAGTSFEMQCLGRWWATLKQDQWPTECKDEILIDFDNPFHDESNGFASVGDRRQEIVLIGKGLDDFRRKAVIQNILDDCLLTDEEYDIYKAKAFKEEQNLKLLFASSIPVQLKSF